MGLLTRDDTMMQVARKRFPPPAEAGGCQGAGLQFYEDAFISEVLIDIVDNNVNEAYSYTNFQSRLVYLLLNW